MISPIDINKLFREKHLTLGSIESFTGGGFAHAMTCVSGASQFFKGALVTYYTEEKISLLGMTKEEIMQYGVVSIETAGQMASRGKRILNVDCAISFTGNAGPEVMENKEAGEIYIGIAYKDFVKVYSYHLSGDRSHIQNQAIVIGCDLLNTIITKW